MNKGIFKINQTDGPTSVELNVWNDGPANGFSEETVSPTPVPSPTDSIGYESQSPDFGRAFKQNHWTGGFGEGLVHNPANETHYGYTDGVLAFFEHELYPGYAESDYGVGVQNGGFEDGTTDPWVATSDITLASSTDSFAGSYAMQLTATGTNGTADLAYPSDLNALTSPVLFGVYMELRFVAKRTNGSGTLEVHAGSESITIDPSSNDEWIRDSVYLPVAGFEISGGMSLQFVVGTSGDVWVVDQLAFVPAHTDGDKPWSSEFNSKPILFKGSNVSQHYYIAMGRAILKLFEAHKVWYPVFVATVEITDLEQFGDATAKLYAALGDGNTYQVSSDGISWDDPDNLQSDVEDYADYFVRAQNSSFDNVLLKVRDTRLSITTTPDDASTWASEQSIGTADRPVTSVLSTNGIAYVGKTDGLYVYDVSAGRMRDIEPDANFFPSNTNFSVSLGRGGVVYASGGQQTFWRVWPAEEGAVIHRWLDMTSLLESPQFEGFGGRTAALAQDRQNIWLLLADDAGGLNTEFPYTFEFDFSRNHVSSKLRLLTLRPPSKDQEDYVTDNLLVAHTVTALDDMGVGEQLGRLEQDASAGLFIFGEDPTTDATDTDSSQNVHGLVPVVKRLALPITAESPRHSASFELRTSGDFYTSWLDFGYPDVEKALGKIVVNTRNCDGNRTVTVYYKTDDDTDDDSTGWTQFPDSSTVVNTSPSQTLSIDTSNITSQVTFKRIRFRLAFSSSSSTADPPIVTGYTIHMSWNPSDYRRFRATVKLSDRRFNTGRRRTEMLPPEVIMERLRELEQQPYVRVTTPFGDEYTAWMRFGQSIESKRQSGHSRRTDYTRVVTIEGTEVRTT